METHSDVSKWAGFAVWDSDNPQVAQLAGRFGQQTRLILTTDYKRKVGRSPQISSASTFETYHIFQNVVPLPPELQCIYGFGQTITSRT